MIDAEFRSEERFSRLSIAYESEKEKDDVCTKIEEIIKKYPLQPETYITQVANAKEVFVIEYHDDCYREAGPIFEEIIKSLAIQTIY